MPRGGPLIHGIAWLAALAITPPASAVDTRDTRLLASPALSADHVAFVYDHSVWIADRDGQHPRRMTTARGEETEPVLSADGRWLAFSGNYDGNLDVYRMPVSGGPPQRLTWHPGDDIVRDIAADGTTVLFQSHRASHTGALAQLYSVSAEGGAPRRLPVPHGFEAALSPDGQRIAYSPHAEPFQQWKHYRGGRASRIWIMDLDDYDTVEIPQPEGRCNDTDPMWIGDTVYLNSDRDGEFNLFRFDETSGDVTALTTYDDYPVIHARSGDDRIVFEQAGRLHVLDPEAEAAEALVIGVGADLRGARPRWATGSDWARAASLSPNGKRLAVGFRGEIVTVPAEDGDVRNLTGSTGTHDHTPVWSPDGTQIAWFSDDGGEYGLHVQAQDGSAPARRYELQGNGFYFDPVWSPDGKSLAFRDNALTIYVMNLRRGTQQTVAQEPVYSPIVTTSYRWSPDSAWLAYTLNEAGLTQTVSLWSARTGISTPITDGLAEVSAPVFDANGQHLYLLGSTDAGPLKDWFAQSNIDMQMNHEIYVVTLTADGPDPLAPASDESTEAGEDDGESAARKPPRVRIDLDGLTQRIQPLVTDTRTVRSLQGGESGVLFYLESEGYTSFDTLSSPSRLVRYTVEDKEAEVIAEDVTTFEVSRDGSRIGYVVEDTYHIADIADTLDGTAVDLDAVRVWVDPRAEWAQIFDEAWRLNRDYFYDPGFHGADWDAVREKYAPLVAHAANRSDLARLLRWMASELAVGHSYSGYGDSIEDPPSVSVGLLGADYDIAEGRYRFAKVFGGLNWSADLRSPLTAPGVGVVAGDYLLEVAGQPVSADDNLLQHFDDTVGHQVTLRVGPRSNGRGSRVVTVTPIGSERGLRHRDWVEGNLRRVQAATDGRVAYVYLPNTSDEGHRSFKRYFYPQSHADAIILDERHNGGGLFADYYIDHLMRPYAAHWAMRYGDDLASPRAAISGPKVMIIDETAGSGGDLLPWMFREYDLGPLVGRRTWGGLVGILGFPPLMDGGFMTSPNLAIWNDEGWIVENEGIPPDIEVDQWPADVNAGQDPQLEKAIAQVLQMLEEDPPKTPTRPAYPVRTR